MLNDETVMEVVGKGGEIELQKARFREIERVSQ